VHIGSAKESSSLKRTVEEKKYMRIYGVSKTTLGKREQKARGKEDIKRIQSSTWKCKE
jgi:hypothetical protein